MIGEPDAGNPHVRFDEGRQETCARAARLSPTLRSPHPGMFFFRVLHAAAIYAISVLGTRSPSRIAKRCNAAFQFCTGMVHFFAICSRARYSSFMAASGLGNEPRVLITFRSDMFSDSTALVV